MIAIYDTKDKTLTLKLKDEYSWGTDLEFCLERYDQTINISGFSFGYTMLADGVVVSEQSWPPPGVKYEKTNQDRLTVVRLDWVPDQEVEVIAWVKTPSGRTEDTLQFLAPRPEQPYPSWTWDSNAHLWVAPVPYPETEDALYSWSEDTGEWILVEEPTAD